MEDWHRMTWQLCTPCWLFSTTLDEYRVISFHRLREGYVVGHWHSRDGFGRFLVSFPYNLYLVANLVFLI